MVGSAGRAQGRGSIGKSGLRASLADTPIALGERPLLAIDVWEHA